MRMREYSASLYNPPSNGGSTRKSKLRMTTNPIPRSARPVSGLRSRERHDWLPQFTELLRPSSTDDVTAQAQATLALAVIRGLMLDDNATGDHSRIDAAFAVFDAP